MAMAEPVALEIRGLGLDGLWPHAPVCYSPPKDDSPPKPRSPPKSASWSNFSLFGFTDDSVANKVEVKTKPAANKVEVKTKPVASVEAKNKAASATSFFIGPAARVKGKEASAGFIEPAASLEGKTKAASVTSFFDPAAKVKAAAGSSIETAAKEDGKPKEESKAKPAEAIMTEIVPQSYIDYLLKHPPRKPAPVSEDFFESFPSLRESILATDAKINRVNELKEDILRQYKNRKFARVGVRFTEGGQRMLFCLSEEDQ